MKRLIALLLAAVMLTAIAVSCGKEKTTDKKDETSPAPATETAKETKGGLQVDTEGGVVTFEW